MAMTKKRISGILLAVALFVGVFAATPAFAATTTTTAKGVTIDWAAETIQFNDANLTVRFNGQDFDYLDATEPCNISALIPTDGDRRMVIHDQRETRDKDEIVVIPARPKTPASISGFTVGVTSIKVSNPNAAYEFSIDSDNLKDFAVVSEFNNLLPTTTHDVRTRVAAVTGKSFASFASTPVAITTADFTSYFVNGAEKTISLKPGYGLYTDSALTHRIYTTDISAYIGKTLYVKNEAKGTYEVVDLSIPAAPAAPKFIAGAFNIDFDGSAASLDAFNKVYEVAVISENSPEALKALKAEDYELNWANKNWHDDGIKPNTTYYFAVRARATNTTLASAPVVVAVTTLRVIPWGGPTYRFDYPAEKIFFGSDVTPLEANTKADFTGTTIKTGDSITALIDATNPVNRVIYFRLPATDKLAASAVSFPVYVPQRPVVAPDAPVVSSTEETITITNKYYVSNVEFSIDGVNWAAKTAFTAKADKVEDGKDYTVYARFMGTSTQFASASAKTATKTIAKKVVTFKSGSTVVATSKFVNGAALAYPAAPVKTGYKFAGWDVAAGTAVTADMTVNAKWTVIKGLKSISKTTGTLTKNSTKSYTLRISKSKSSVKVIAKKAFSGQKVKTYFGGKTYSTNYKTVKLAKGASRTVKFRAYAADGSYMTYTVKVVRNK